MADINLLADAGKSSLARRLAAVEKEDRVEAVEDLRAWVAAQRNLSEIDYMKAWKAIFYCVWLADKVAFQQYLTDEIAKLVHVIPDGNLATRFMRAFFQLVQREWLLLDKWRLDKFLSLVRKIFRQFLVYVGKTRAWHPQSVKHYIHVMQSMALARPPNDVRMHLADIFAGEVGNAVPLLSTAQLRVLLVPYYMQLVDCSSVHVFRRIAKECFAELGHAIREAHQSVLEEEEDADTTDHPLRRVNLAAIAWDIFEAAASTLTREEHRAALYDLHEVLDEMAADCGHTYAPSDAVQRGTVAEEEEEEEEEEDGSSEDVDGPVGDILPGMPSVLRQVAAQQERARNAGKGGNRGKAKKAKKARQRANRRKRARETTATDEEVGAPAKRGRVGNDVKTTAADDDGNELETPAQRGRVCNDAAKAKPRTPEASLVDATLGGKPSAITKKAKQPKKAKKKQAPPGAAADSAVEKRTPRADAEEKEALKAKRSSRRVAFATNKFEALEYPASVKRLRQTQPEVEKEAGRGVLRATKDLPMQTTGPSKSKKGKKQRKRRAAAAM